MFDPYHPVMEPFSVGFNAFSIPSLLPCPSNSVRGVWTKSTIVQNFRLILKHLMWSKILMIMDQIFVLCTVPTIDFVANFRFNKGYCLRQGLAFDSYLPVQVPHRGKKNTSKDVLYRAIHDNFLWYLITADRPLNACYSDKPNSAKCFQTRNTMFRRLTQKLIWFRVLR